MFHIIIIIDQDGDQVAIFNMLDFEIFRDQLIQKVYLVPGNSETHRDDNDREVSSCTAKVVHENVICDGCDAEIHGFRYKCLQCRDYDLCMKCETKHLHPQHSMIRIPDSNLFVSNIENN